MISRAVHARLTSLDEKYMHCDVRHDDEADTKSAEAEDVPPDRLIIETKRTEDRCPRNGNVDAVLLVDQCQLHHLVDDEGLEAVVEYGQALQPDGRLWYGVVVQQEAGEEETEEHDQAADQIG